VNVTNQPTNPYSSPNPELNIKAVQIKKKKRNKPASQFTTRSSDDDFLIFIK